MFASATGRNLYLPRVRQLNPCQPLGLKCPTLSQWQEWTLLVQFTPGWRSLSLPKRTLHYLPVPASTRAVHLKLCRDLSSAQFQRALKDLLPGEDALWPCKWQRKTCGYREMVVYPQEGSRSWKLHWNSITWKFNLAWPFGGEVSSNA